MSCCNCYFPCCLCRSSRNHFSNGKEVCFAADTNKALLYSHWQCCCGWSVNLVWINTGKFNLFATCFPWTVTTGFIVVFQDVKWFKSAILKINVIVWFLFLNQNLQACYQKIYLLRSFFCISQQNNCCNELFYISFNIIVNYHPRPSCSKVHRWTLLLCRLRVIGLHIFFSTKLQTSCSLFILPRVTQIFLLVSQWKKSCFASASSMTDFPRW